MSIFIECGLIIIVDKMFYKKVLNFDNWNHYLKILIQFCNEDLTFKPY